MQREATMTAQPTLCGTALHYTAQRGQEAELAQLLAKVKLLIALCDAALAHELVEEHRLLHAELCLSSIYVTQRSFFAAIQSHVTEHSWSCALCGRRSWLLLWWLLHHQHGRSRCIASRE